MRIRDITLDDIREGLRWRVLNPDAELEPDFLFEELEIEPLSQFTEDDQVVYPGVLVHLRDLGEPRTGWWDVLRRRGRSKKRCRHAPEDPRDLTEEMEPVVAPVLMIKVVREDSGDLCEFTESGWRQMGIGITRERRDVPFITDYFNLLDDEMEFSVDGEFGPTRDSSRRGFWNWVKYLGRQDEARIPAEVPNADPQCVLHLADCVSPRRVVRIDGSPSVDDLLKRLLDGVAAEFPQIPKDAVCREMLDREKVFPTAIGRGVAIPHGTCEALRGPLVSIAQLPDGMEFAAPDRKPVRLVFLLLSPPDNPQQHRLLLAEIARLCANADLLEQLRTASIPDELMTLLAPSAGGESAK